MSNPSDNLEKIIRLACEGNQSAVTALYEAHVDKIYRYIRFRVAEEDAEDLTAEVFVKMVEGLPTYEITGAPFEAWLYRIAAARIADHHRRQQRRTTTALSETMSIDDPEPEERLLEAQEVEVLREALSDLSDDYRTVLLLRFVEQKSHEEVAAILGRSEAAVKNIQYRALKDLTRLLGSENKARHYLRGSND